MNLLAPRRLIVQRRPPSPPAPPWSSSPRSAEGPTDSRADISTPQRTGIPIPMPIYEIEAASNGRTPRLLNLPLPRGRPAPGADPGRHQRRPAPRRHRRRQPDQRQAGTFNNPPRSVRSSPSTSRSSASSLRAILTTPTSNTPLRIGAKLTIARLGRRRADCGSASATTPAPAAPSRPSSRPLGGIQDFFNPLKARIDTTGGRLLGLDPGPPRPRPGPARRPTTAR